MSIHDRHAPKPPTSRTAAVAGLAGTVVLAVLGALAAKHLLHAHAFALDAEYTVPAFWSGFLLLGASVAAVLAYRAHGWRALLALAVLFAYMCVDEVTAIHEHLETATGIDWQILLSPVILAAAVAFLLVLRRSTTPLDVALLLAGGAAWAVSQLLERWEWDGDIARGGYLTKMVSEESLEMLGSLLILVALLRLWEAAPARQNAERPALAGLS